MEGIIPEYDRKGKVNQTTLILESSSPFYSRSRYEALRALPLRESFLRMPTLAFQTLLRLQLQHTSSSAPTATVSTTA